jgi:hypothetical protein
VAAPERDDEERATVARAGEEARVQGRVSPDDDPMARTVLAPPPTARRRPPPAAAEPAPAPPPSRAAGLDAPTIEASTRRFDWDPPPESEHTARRAGALGLADDARDLLHRHERLLWWLHTAYALGLGLFVATFAQKGFERARWLAVSLALAWILVALFFRFFGTGARQDFLTAWPGARRRFFVMTYVMKNLFQGMLFFLLPFYWRAASHDAGTAGPLVLVAACAVVSTLDLVVDRFLFRWKVMASAFYAVTLFGCLQVLVAALVPAVTTITRLVLSGGLAVAAFLLFHLPLTTLRRPLVAGLFVATVGGGAAAAYGLREAIPAVPMFVREGAVGPALGPDGTLTLEVRAFRAGHLEGVWAVSDVSVIGEGEPLHHTWRHRGRAVLGATPSAASRPAKDTLRVTSHLPRSAMPADPTGRWTVDVRTSSGQVVGRTAFDVRP